MYKIVSLASLFIRTVLLPNPFETLCVNEGTAFLVNATIGNIIMLILSYSMCGIFYTRGIDHASKGSFLYLLFFTMNTFIFITLGNYIKVIKWFIIIGLCLYFIIYALLIFIRLKMNNSRMKI